MSENLENKDNLIITENDIAEALNGNFLEKMKEYAWRGKRAKLADLPDEEMHSFNIMVGFTFAADSEDKEPLNFSKLTGYRFQCSPCTYNDIRASNENTEENTQSIQVLPLPKKATNTRKRNSVLEGKGSELQEVPRLIENPEQFKHFHHIVTLSAFRYALGRKGYLVADMVDWLKAFWKEIPRETKAQIITDVEGALDIGFTGDECDQDKWEDFMEFVNKRSKFL